MEDAHDPDDAPLSDDELEAFEALTGQLTRRRTKLRVRVHAHRRMAPRYRLFAAGLCTSLAVSACVALLAVSHWAAFAAFVVTVLVLVNRFPSLNEAALSVRNDAVTRLLDAADRQRR
jgi:hypothetical protein